MRILYSAFKGTHNTSFQLVNQLIGDRLFLTNSFQGLQKDISTIELEYDAIFMFGVDKNLNNEIRIETCAKYSDEKICSSYDILTLENKIKNLEISYTISNRPTAYLCNAAYYHILKKNLNTVFIHIPSLKGMNDGLMKQLLMLA